MHRERAAPGRRAARRRAPAARAPVLPRGDGGDAPALLLRSRPTDVARTGDPGRCDRRLAGRRPIKEILRQGGLTYPEPQGAVEGLLYHWAPTLITAPREVQLLARRYMFNLAAIAATLVSFLFSWLVFGNEVTRPWIGILYFAFGVVLPAPADPHAAQGARDDRVAGRPDRRRDPRPGRDRPGRARSCRRSARSRSNMQTFVMLGTALVACGLAMAAILAQVDARRRRAPASSRTRLVDERAAVDADGRARPDDAGGVDRAHPEPPLRADRSGDDGGHAEPAASPASCSRKASRCRSPAPRRRPSPRRSASAAPPRAAAARPVRDAAGARGDRPDAVLRAPLRHRRAVAGQPLLARSAPRRSSPSSPRSASRRRRACGAASTSSRC